jgi:hypothetical protein
MSMKAVSMLQKIKDTNVFYLSLNRYKDRLVIMEANEGIYDIRLDKSQLEELISELTEIHDMMEHSFENNRYYDDF